MEKHQPRTESELADGFHGSVLAVVVLKAGGEVRFRFRDLTQAKLFVSHDPETDELVLRATKR